MVHLGDDPFPVEVGVDKLIPKEYIDTMTTKTKRPTAKAEGTTTTRTRTARKVAAPAAAPAKRAAKKAAAPAKPARAAKATSATKKAPAAAGRVHKTDPDTWPVPGKNPYRPGSNLAKITDVLLKGGKRAVQVAKLQKVIDMHPYTQAVEDLDVEKELDKRLMLTAGLLERDFGFVIEKSGRGMESGTVKVIPPAA